MTTNPNTGNGKWPDLRSTASRALGFLYTTDYYTTIYQGSRHVPMTVAITKHNCHVTMSQPPPLQNNEVMAPSMAGTGREKGGDNDDDDRGSDQRAPAPIKKAQTMVCHHLGRTFFFFCFVY